MRPAVRPAPVPAVGTGELFPWVVAALALVVVVVWAGAMVASVLHLSPALPSLNDAGTATLYLPANFGDPAAAWPHPLRDRLPGPVLYWVGQLAAIAGAAAAGVGATAAWRRLTGRRPGSLGVEADAGFARRRDLRRLAVDTPEPGRLTLGHSAGRLVACEPQASLAVVGPTGCGKTAGFAIPAILEWKGPVLATSVKADLLGATIEHRRRRGKVWVYDPTGAAAHATDSWSPIGACATWAGAMRVAAWMTEAAQPRIDTVSDGDYWYSQARKGLAPYLHAAALANAGIADLVRWVDTQERRDVEDALRSSIGPVDAETDRSRWDELFDASVAITRDLCQAQGGDTAALAEQPLGEWPEWLVEQVRGAVDIEWRLEMSDAARPGRDDLAPLTAATALWDKERRLRGSVFATMENVLAGWADPGVANAGAGTEIDLSQWLDGDNTLYVVATAHEQARLRPVLTVLVQQAIRQAYDRAVGQDGRLDHPCLLMLDEAGNTAPLRDLPGYASTARSHGITLVSVWQDLAQIKAIYHDRAQTVLNNHRAKLFGAGIADATTLEYVSRLVGDEHRTERNVSADLTGRRRSVTEHRTYRRAAPIDVLRRIQPGEAVLVYGSELPAHIRLRPWFRDPALNAVANGRDLSGPEGRWHARLRR